MTSYNVTFGYRTDDGMYCSTPTHTGTVEIEADDEHASRLEAIDEAYRTLPVCSHVTITSVKPLA